MTFRVRDDQARDIEFERAPRRVVSLVPSVTELVCTLGGADRLVAVTQYCAEPSEAVQKLEKVGGPKDPACDRIVALRPDVVLLSSEENRRQDFERLVGAGLSVFVVAVTSVYAAARSVERMGRLLEEELAARVLAGEIDAAREELAGAAVSGKRRVFCPVWRNPWITFNADTFAHDVLACAGGSNVCAAEPERYPHVDLPEVARRSPEVVLLPNEPYRFTEGDVKALDPLVGTPAWGNGRIYCVDGRALFWPGPRTPGALRDFRDLLGCC